MARSQTPSAFGIELDEKAYASYGIEPTEAEKASLSGTDGLESIPALFRAHGMDVSAAEFFARRGPSDIIYREFPIKVSPGAREVMERLRAAGAHIAVVSTTRHALVEARPCARWPCRPRRACDWRR
jgi:beta-phosphoglucomutase-like phosphatase (HAD superfamily)